MLHVANLARLALTEEEVERLGEQLRRDPRGGRQGRRSSTSPTSSRPRIRSTLVNVWAEDEPRPSLPLEAALANAPEREDDAFRVPPTAAPPD